MVSVLLLLSFLLNESGVYMVIIEVDERIVVVKFELEEWQAIQRFESKHNLLVREAIERTIELGLTGIGLTS